MTRPEANSVLRAAEAAGVIVAAYLDSNGCEWEVHFQNGDYIALDVCDALDHLEMSHD